MPVTPGQTVGSYTVEALLGRGGQAEVWRVRHRALDSLAALKVLHISSAWLEKRLVQEGKVQASLRHPNIVSVLDLVSVDNALGLLLEFVDGPTLADLVETGALALPEAESVFAGILAAVEAAHERGIVHRDLKPANVLLAPIGSGAVLPKVADFGLARLLDAAAGMGTRSGAAMGTPDYMAPEQMRDARNVDERADVFALGCVLYELVTGLRPFRAGDLVAGYRAIEEGRYVRPSALVPGLPDRFDRAVDGCLAFRPEDRFATVAALRAALEGASSVPGAIRLAVPEPGAQATRSAPTFGDDGSFGGEAERDEVRSEGRFSAVLPGGHAGDGRAGVSPGTLVLGSLVDGPGMPRVASTPAASATGLANVARDVATSPAAPVAVRSNVATVDSFADGNTSDTPPSSAAPRRVALVVAVLAVLALTGGAASLGRKDKAPEPVVETPRIADTDAARLPGDGRKDLPPPDPSGPSGESEAVASAGSTGASAGAARPDAIATPLAAGSGANASSSGYLRPGASPAVGSRSGAGRPGRNDPPPPPSPGPPVPDAAGPISTVNAAGAGATGSSAGGTGSPAVVDGPSPAAQASFRTDGLYDVRLEGDGGTFAPGDRVPPGDYTITADFGAGRKEAGHVTLADGARPTVRCSVGGGRCVAR